MGGDFLKETNPKPKPMEKKDLQQKALEIFKVHSFDKLYLTSDGQAFTKKHYAVDHSRKLEDKEVTPFERKDFTKTSNPQQDAPFDYEKIDKELSNDRDFLFARYEALIGKKAPHNIGTEKLAEKVQEIEAEKFPTPAEDQKGGNDTPTSEGTGDDTPNANLELAKNEEAINYEEQKELLEDREFLFARHETLAGEKPAHNIGTEKLAGRVQELEKEKFNTQKIE